MTAERSNYIKNEMYKTEQRPQRGRTSARPIIYI